MRAERLPLTAFSSSIRSSSSSMSAWVNAAPVDLAAPPRAGQQNHPTTQSSVPTDHAAPQRSSPFADATRQPCADATKRARSLACLLACWACCSAGARHSAHLVQHPPSGAPSAAAARGAPALAPLHPSRTRCSAPAASSCSGGKGRQQAAGRQGCWGNRQQIVGESHSSTAIIGAENVGGCNLSARRSLLLAA